MELYPNPATSFVNIAMDTNEKSDQVEIIVLDVTGKIMDQLSNENIFADGKIFKYDVGKYPSGFYFILCNINNKVYQKQLVVSKKQ